MKTSYYNIATENAESGELVLFNALYGSTIVIDARNKREAISILDRSGLSASSDGHSSKLEDELARLMFLIGDNIDELAILRNRKLAGIKDRNRLDVILMPNLYCNFACPYCYEHHDRSKRISKEVRDRVVRWIGKEIPKYKVLLLNWFGGEPLIDSDTILSMTTVARSKCEEHNTRLLTNITTNGYLLTKKLIPQFISLGLYSYQITVDGPPETHNKTRVLRSGKGSFEKIYENIVALAEADGRVKISLRVNYNHNNIYEIPRLLGLFPRNIRSQLRVVFEPVFGVAELSATKNMPGAEISRVITAYYELAESLGYDIRLGGIGVGKLVYCYAERESQYIIDYKGDVFKCSVTDFSTDKRVGAIDVEGNFVREERNTDEWYGVSLFEPKCERCVFLPLCMGGCRKDRIENGATGSYCSLVPTNTSHALKSIAFGSFSEVLKKEVQVSRACANRSQSCQDCELLNHDTKESRDADHR